MDQALDMLKVDLGITTDRYDTRLILYIEEAIRQMKREGATITNDDCGLVVMYAAWLWRRRDTGEGMPRMIRYALNNRIFSEKM